MRTGVFPPSQQDRHARPLPRGFETYRVKPFGLAEPKRWIRREKGCVVSVVVVGSTGRRLKEER
jgi:hypothetical protein